MLSLNQYLRRMGAGTFRPVSTFAVMKDRTIVGNITEPTYGSDRSLERHLDNLRREFTGESELLWYHAKLIVLLRREFRIKETFVEFNRLWNAEESFLCQGLNVRWLISAADTFVDHHPDPQVRAVGLMVSLIGNVIKLHESERWLNDIRSSKPDIKRMEQASKNLVPLFGGTSCFTVGTDDTLRNLYWRLERFLDVRPTGSILQSVWDHFQLEDTVFARMRKLHTRRRTRWWDESHDQP